MSRWTSVWSPSRATRRARGRPRRSARRATRRRARSPRTRRGRAGRAGDRGARGEGARGAGARLVGREGDAVGAAQVARLGEREVDPPRRARALPMSRATNARVGTASPAQAMESRPARRAAVRATRDRCAPGAERDRSIRGTRRHRSSPRARAPGARRRRSRISTAASPAFSATSTISPPADRRYTRTGPSAKRTSSSPSRSATELARAFRRRWTSGASRVVLRAPRHRHPVGPASGSSSATSAASPSSSP